MAFLTSRVRAFLVMTVALPLVAWTATRVARHLEKRNDGVPTMSSRGLGAVGSLGRTLSGRSSSAR